MNFKTVGELVWSSQSFRHPIDLNNSLKFMNTKLDAAGTYLNLAILSLSTYFPKLGFSAAVDLFILFHSIVHS